MSRYLRANDVLRTPNVDGQRWRVLNAFPLDGAIKLYDYQARQEVYRSVIEISADLESGRLVLDRVSAPAVSAATHNDPALTERTQKALSQLHKVENFSRALNISFAEAYEVAKAEALAKDPPVDFASRATLYRHRHRQRNDLPLIQGSLNKGNRMPRYEQSVYDLITHAARTLFLQTGSRWTMSALTQYINDQALKQRLVKPGQGINASLVKKHLKESGVVDASISRLDPKLVPASKSIAMSRIMVQAPFERVEQDAVHLPFVIETPEGPFDNVYLVHAIDCCTSMPLGWHLVIGSPSESDGLRCVESILFSKKAVFERLGLDPSIDVFGTPHQLVMDNGPETRGERTRKLPALGIDIRHCKARHPHEKPFIERLNRSLKEALETLPGCTRLDGKDGQRDPVRLGDGCMTAMELERWIVRWYYECWAHSPLERLINSNIDNSERLGDTPAARWAHITQDQPIPLPPTRNEWRLALFEHHERTLSRKTGITVGGGLSYRGENLGYLIAKYGEERVKVLVDPDDFRQVFVYDGEDLPLVPLTEVSVDDTTPGYTVREVKEMRSQRNESIEESNHPANFRSDLYQRSIEGKDGAPGKKRSRLKRNREVVGAAKKSAALERADAQPLMSVQRPSTGADYIAPMETDFAFDDTGTLTVLNRMNGEEIV